MPATARRLAALAAAAVALSASAVLADPQKCVEVDDVYIQGNPKPTMYAQSHCIPWPV